MGTAAAVTQNAMRYVGGFQESANLYKLGARYYDATIGRFTQADPSGREANPYAYGAGNPISNSDRTGLSAISLIADAVAGLVSAATCAIAPLVGCIAISLLYGGIIGAVVGGLEAQANGEDTQAGAVNGAIEGLVGAGLGLIAGALGPIIGDIVKSAI